MGEHIIVDRRQTITELTLNRLEKLGALNGAIVEELIDAVEKASSDGTRLLVFFGAGKGFSGELGKSPSSGVVSFTMKMPDIFCLKSTVENDRPQFSATVLA